MEITESQIVSEIKMIDALVAVKQAFIDYANGIVSMPAKIYLDIPEVSGDFRAMPVRDAEFAAIKWVNSHPQNRGTSIPSVMARMILNDAKTGKELATFPASYLTNLRTGAAGAIAAETLHFAGKKSLGLIGLGAQAQFQLWALLESKLAPFDGPIRLFDVNRNENFENWIKEKLDYPLNLEFCDSAEQLVKNSDIVVTTTPGKTPVVDVSWVHKKTLFVCIGADGPGKMELDPQILKQADIIVDDLYQSSHSGEINVALEKAVVSESDVMGTLGDILTKKIPFPTQNKEKMIRVFDSTGIAVQDLAMAKLVYNKVLVTEKT